MDSTYRGTPTWLIGMLVVFAVAAAATFGLFIANHAELSALEEQALRLRGEAEELRPRLAGLTQQLPVVDQQIAQRRERVAALVENDKTSAADVDNLVTRNQATVKTNAEAQAKELETFTTLMREAPERRKELGKEEERAFASERDADERRRQARDDVEKLSQAIEQLKKKGRGENVGLDNRVVELESRVRQLTNQYDLNALGFKSDGQIVASQARDGFVVLDRGLKHNLRKYTKFTVYNQRGGKIIEKGHLQVIRVEDTLSVARVIDELDLNDPLIAGDHLHNPVYDPEKVLGFAVRGDFANFSAAELKRFIVESGGRVDADLSVNTDYLVAGDRAGAAVEQAGKVGVVILSEQQLVEFVRPKPRFASVRGFEYIDAAAAQHKSFVFKGTFTKANEGLIKDYITKRGGTIQGSLAPGIEAVIVGDHAEADMAKARELDIVVVDQTQFSHLQPETKK